MRAFARPVLVTAAFLLGVFSLGQAARHDQEDHAVYNEYSPTLNVEFPIETKKGFYVAYRYSQAPVPGDLEYSFLIGGSIGEATYADLRVAEGVSIFEQMTALHLAQPRKPVRELRGKLKIRVSHITVTDCPAVRDQFDKLQKLVLPAPRFDFVTVDGPVNEIRIASSTGQMNFDFLDERYPLVSWAHETKQSLETCTHLPGPQN